MVLKRTWSGCCLGCVILPRKFLAVSRRSGCRPGSLSKPPQLPPLLLCDFVPLYLCTPRHILL